MATWRGSAAICSATRPLASRTTGVTTESEVTDGTALPIARSEARATSAVPGGRAPRIWSPVLSGNDTPLPPRATMAPPAMRRGPSALEGGAAGGSIPKPYGELGTGYRLRHRRTTVRSQIAERAQLGLGLEVALALAGPGAEQARPPLRQHLGELPAQRRPGPVGGGVGGLAGVGVQVAQPLLAGLLAH